MASPSNNRDAIIGFVGIAIIIIGIVAVVLYFIPSEQEPAPEQETKNEVVVDSDYTEAVSLSITYYNVIEKTFRDLYEHCESVSNYEEYYEFSLLAKDIGPTVDAMNVNDAKMTESIIRLGLEDNTEINNSMYLANVAIALTESCIYDLIDKYG